MADMFDDAWSALRDGPAGPAATAAPVPKVDMHDEAVARLRPDQTTEQLLAKKGTLTGQSAPVPDWNMGNAIGNGMMQGFLPETIAGENARKAHSEKHGQLSELLTPFWKLPEYVEELEKAKAIHAAYGKENPGKALTGELAGSMATIIPAMAAGGAGLGALATRGVSAIPKLGGLVDFLSGASKIPGLGIVSQATRGAAEGTVAAAGSSNLSDAPLSEQMKTGAGVGAVLGPVGSLIGKAVGSHVNATTADTAQALVDQSIPIRAGQVPGSNKIAQGLDKVFGGGNAAQREEFGQRLTGFAGLPEKEVSQGWVAKNDQRVGKVMNDIQSVYSIPALEPKLLTDLGQIRSDALGNMSVDNAKKVAQFVSKIEDNVINPMSGGTYKNLTQKGGLLDNIKADKDIATVAPKLREALDDAWGRALPADKKAAWDQARHEYKVTRVIDDSMGASGASEGVYNPKKLLKAVEDRFGNVENAGDLGMLARGGQFLEAPGAAPASAKHGAMKTIGTLALGGAAATAANEGAHVLTHWGPETLAAIAQHPENMALPFVLGAGIYGGGKAANSAMNGPRATQYLLDIARGIRKPLLRGNNPSIPLAVEGYNRQ